MVAASSPETRKATNSPLPESVVLSLYSDTVTTSVVCPVLKEKKDLTSAIKDRRSAMPRTDIIYVRTASLRDKYPMIWHT